MNILEGEVKNIPAKYYDTEFTVKPYWITLDGDKVYGIETQKSITQGLER